ncbi:MAG: CotH kinase family protein [Bacteroidota bacterium]
MKIFKRLFLFGMAVMYFSSSFSRTIIINEFVASNDQSFADEAGEFDDWVEIYNAGNTAFDLGGLYVTDDLTEPTQWQIPSDNPASTTIPPKGYLILWFDGDEEQGPLHVAPKLKGGGEQMGLFAADGITPLDTLTYGEQQTDVSQGRFPDGSSSFVFYESPSPNTSNTTPLEEVVENPVFNKSGGLYNSTLTVTLQTQPSDATIFYTTDGSDPSQNSIPYNGPISVASSQVIRAKAFKAGATPSEISTETFLINTSHTFPIVALSGNPATFFDEAEGLFPNYEEDIEVPLNIEFYETDGTTGFNQTMEVEIHGSTSAVLPQKSLALKAKRSLGSATIDYPVFPDEDLDQYRSLILRNSGQDWEYSFFRDALQSTLATNQTGLAVDIESMDLDDQAYRPVIAYLNGVYWGMYNLRERSDKRYIKNRYGLDDDEIDLIENLDDAKEGDFVAWNALDSLLQAGDFSDATGLATLDQLVDLDQYQDYILHNIFMDNTDWPGNNFLRWRPRQADGKWRFMTKDLDFGFGFVELNSGNFNTGNPYVNSLNRLLNPSAFYPNPEWATLLFNKLIENPTWRVDFINRLADQLNVLFTKERMLQQIDELQSTYQPEVNQHNQKWENLWTWNEDVDVLRTFAEGRTAAVRNHFIGSFSEIDENVSVTLDALPRNGGVIKINTVTTKEAALPWTGTYFDGVEIPLQAIPNPGFRFAGWSANVTGDAKTSVILDGNSSITAIFVPEGGDGGPLNQVINFTEIDDKLTTDAPFIVDVSASSGLPVSLNLISGPATLEGNLLTLDGTTGTVFLQASQAGNEFYNAATTVSRFFDIKEEEVVVNENYCFSKGDQPWQEYIAAVQFQTINNLSEKDNYGDFTSQSATVKQGESYPISLRPGFSWSHQEEVFAVWIDWNQDKDFSSDEQVFVRNYTGGIGGTPASPIVGNITIPLDAKLGNTRMRVVMQRAYEPTACGFFMLGETEDYTIMVEAAGDGISELTIICTSDLTVNASADSDGATVSWALPEVVSNCPDGVNAIVRTGGLASGQFFPIGNTIITYQVTDNCGNVESCNIEVNVTKSSEYCAVKGNQPWQEYIANVSLADIDYSSFKEGYSDFTNIQTDLVIGQSYDISLLAGFSYFQWDEVFQVWIDYDGNGSFEEANELVFSNNYSAQAASTPPQPVTGTLTIPNTIDAKSTRMRVTMRRNQPADNCTTFEFGEIEDYTIRLVQPSSARTNDLTTASWTIFPNPATTHLTIQTSDWLGKTGHFQLLDAVGKLHQTVVIQDISEATLTLPVDQLPNGWYYLKVSIDGQQDLFKKLVISRLY